MKLTSARYEELLVEGPPLLSRPEDRRLRFGRLESLAALAGGVMHEMNNLTASVMMTVQVLEPGCTDAADRQALSALDELARRLQHAGRQLHWLARGVAGEPTLFQPQYLISDLQKLAAVALSASVAVVTRYPADLWALAGDPLTVYQLLLALLLEARDHLPHGGALVLAARNALLDAPAQTRAGARHPRARAAAGELDRLPYRYVVFEALAEPAGVPPAGDAACAGGQPPTALARFLGPSGGSGTSSLAAVSAPSQRRRSAAKVRRAAAAAGALTEPVAGPGGRRYRGRRAYLPAATFGDAP